MVSPQEDSDLDSIQRCPHDSDNPYTMVLNALLRNPEITPNCRWLLSYLLSNDKGWKIKPKQIMNHLDQHMKRDSVYKILNEAISTGYMKREEIRINGKFSGYKWFVSETPKFKKLLPNTEIPYAALPLPIKADYKNEQDLKKEQCLKNDQYHAISLSFSDDQKERKEASKIEFIRGRLVGIPKDLIESWQRAYPSENIEAYIAQFENVLTLNPKSIASKHSWEVRINSWIVKQSQIKAKLKEQVIQSVQPVKEELPKIEEKKEPVEMTTFGETFVKSFINDWSEKLGEKGLISLCSSVLSVRLHLSKGSWDIPIHDNKIFRFVNFLEEKIKQELQLTPTANT